MTDRRGLADALQRITEINARSGKFLLLLQGVSGLPAKPTMAQVVALEVGTNAGYSTRPAWTLAGTPTELSDRVTVQMDFVFNVGAAMSVDGAVLIWGGTSTLGNTTGNVFTIYDEIGLRTWTASSPQTLQITYGEALNLL
jgi:hypothetical protein